MQSQILVQASGLTKYYGDLAAVNGIDFSIHGGECYGFLGPNGAGKTTTMKMISCVSPVGAGELLVNGMDVRAESRKIKQVLGIVSQSDSLDPDLSVLQNLVSHARFFGMSGDEAKSKAWESLDLFQLRDRAHGSPDDLSGGMRRRLLIARSLLHGPKILVLDEPTTGLDPQNRLLVWERLFHLKAQGITILLTTHYMEEAAYLCDRLVVMDAGKILVEGTPDVLIKDHVGDLVTEVRVGILEKDGLADTFRDKGLKYDDHGDSLILYGQNGSIHESIGLDGRYQIINRPGNLEDVFLRLTGRGLREE